jgi:hypothetical protein
VALVIVLSKGNLLQLEAVLDVVDLLNAVVDIVAALLLRCVGAGVCSSVLVSPVVEDCWGNAKNTY